MLCIKQNHELRVMYKAHAGLHFLWRGLYTYFVFSKYIHNAAYTN